jgi:selenocysteine-specific elongation factor
MEALKTELEKLARSIQPKNPQHHFRMPIDRVFVIKGFGTVVTGTLIAGTVEKEAEIEVYPLGRRARVRGVEVHNRPVGRAWAGQRTALNLAGVETENLARGMVLAAPGRFYPTQRVDCVLDLLASARPLKHCAPVHFHAGTAQVEAEVHLLETRTQLKPGARAFAQLRLSEPVLVLPGDRFIIRQFSPVITIGGGLVLDNLAPKHRVGENVVARLERLRSPEPQQILEVLLEQAPAGLGLAEIVARTGWLEAEVEAATAALERGQRAERVGASPLWLVHRDHFRAGLERTVTELEAFHKQNPLLPGIAKELLRSRQFPAAPPALLDALLERLKRDRKVVVDGDTVRLSTHRIVLKQDETQARQKIVAAFEQAGLTVPAVAEVLGKVVVEPERARKILQILLRERVLVRVTDELVFHRAAIESLKALLAEQKKKSDRLSVPQFKDLTGITRKYAIPLLEFLDREKVTRRAGDQRIIL